MCSYAMYGSRKRIDRYGVGVSRAGMTLVELLLALGIMVIVVSVVYMSFAGVANAWRVGLRVADSLDRGDFIADQLVAALRSAYYPDTGRLHSGYGFVMENNGEGPAARDVISWVKIGSALVGQQCSFAGTAHRVRVSVEEDDEGGGAMAVRAWQIYCQKDDFEPDDVPPVVLSKRVKGFNCRVAYRKVDDVIEWLDEWTETNRLPTVFELTLYIEPPQSGEQPIEVKRVLGVPVSVLTWRHGT